MLVEGYVFTLLGIFFCLAAVCQITLYIFQRNRWLMTIVERYIEFDAIPLMFQTIDVLSMAFLWYTISLSFTIYNKWFMQEWKGGFNFPIFITAVHMSMKFIISRVWSCSPTIEKIENITWTTFFTIVFPIGMLTALDIVLTNAAILYLPLTTVTTIKGSSLIFTFICGIILKLEVFRWSLFTAVVGITVGLAIAVTNSFSFNAVGLALAISSALFSGLRWALMQFLALKDHQSQSVMVTLYRFSPASVITILPCFFLLETFPLATSHFTIHMKDFYDACLLSCLGGGIAFVLIMVEVKLVRLTSSLTLNVLGQLKEIIQIGLAMLLFKENLTLKGMGGILISILSSLYYRYVIIGLRQERDASILTLTASSSTSSGSLKNLSKSSHLNLQKMHQDLHEQELAFLGDNHHDAEGVFSDNESDL